MLLSITSTICKNWVIVISSILNVSFKFNFCKAIRTLSLSLTSPPVNKSLKSGKTYYYKVRAYKTANGITTYGAYSTVKNVKVK